MPQEESRRYSARDRSAIYGGFHLYVKNGAMSALEHPSAHAALMDGVYRHQRHVYDLTRKYYLLGRDRLIEGLDVPPGGSVLELGCGTGRNLVRAALAYPDARFFGLDISAGMLETAAAAIERQGACRAAIALARGDASDFDAAGLFGQAGFDRVFISYALSMIPEWEATIARGARRARARRLAPHRRFRRPGAPAALVPQRAARMAGETSTSVRVIRCANCLNRNARRIGATLRFETLYRDYAVHAVITRPA